MTQAKNLHISCTGMLTTFMDEQCRKVARKWFPMKKNDKFTFNEEFNQDYDKDNDKEYILEVDVKYRKELHKVYSDLLLLPKNMKIYKNEKLLCTLYDKNNVIHMRVLK